MTRTDRLSQTRPITMAGRQATELTIESFALAVVQGPDSGQRARLASTSLTIGSDAGNDLVLRDAGVSRKHAALMLTPDGVLLEDLGSTNGTWVGGARIRQAIVTDGTQIHVGTTQIELRVGPEKLVYFPSESDGLLELVGRSPAMREVFALVQQLARTDLPVSITGETGTGKELVARALHQCGPRREKSFLVLDCGIVAEELLRSELFGHEKGAFTGADAVRKGILEEAAGGTVMLDELGEMKPTVQPHLLRALETREITRMGSNRPFSVDFRVVSATNRDLAEMVEQGKFREDLYYRLCGVVIHLPPLRDRAGDVPLLAARFADACAQRHAAPAPQFASAAIEALCEHRWPGNVRELRHVVEKLVVLSNGKAIGADAVRQELSVRRPRAPATGASAPSGAVATAASPPRTSPAPETLADAEKAAIERALAATHGNKKAAARRLGISASTFFAKLKLYGIKTPGQEEA